MEVLGEKKRAYASVAVLMASQHPTDEASVYRLAVERPAAERLSATSITAAATPPGLWQTTMRHLYGVVAQKSRDRF